MKKTVKVYNGGHDASVVSLTKFFKKLGIKKEDKLFVETNNDKIYLSKNPMNSNKLDIISDDVWNAFEGVLVKLYGKDTINNRKEIKKYVEEALKEWIRKKDKWYNKKILKI